MKEKLLIIDEKLSKGQTLSELEKEIYCGCCMVSTKGLDNLPDLCEGFKFKTLYLNYYKDLSFQSKYVKPKFGMDDQTLSKAFEKLKESNDNADASNDYDQKRQDESRDYAMEMGLVREVEQDEIRVDKKYLFDVADQWQKEIDITNHTNTELRGISEETREIIREIRKKCKRENLSITKLNNEIRLALWKSKYIYHHSLKIAEQISLPYKLNLNGVNVYFTYISLIHILNRHFAQLVSMKYHKESKSFHSPIFKPLEIHLTLESIFRRLSNTEVFKSEKIAHNNAYNFCFHETDYQLYLKKFGQSKEKLRVSSLYPIENELAIKKLQLLKLIKVDNELSVYVKE